MDARNRDELLKKQEQLEVYLLDHPQSSLFAWYARQNMEAGELDRALKICRLGLQGGRNPGLLHKLMGECYMAKGEVTQAMKHFVETVLSGEPFAGAVTELIKNLSTSMEADEIAFLVRQMNLALPGHPEATRFFSKYPTARALKASDHQFDFLKDLAASLSRKPPVTEPPVTEPEFPAETVEDEPMDRSPDEATAAELPPELGAALDPDALLPPDDAEPEDWPEEFPEPDLPDFSEPEPSPHLELPPETLEPESLGPPPADDDVEIPSFRKTFEEKLEQAAPLVMPRKEDPSADQGSAAKHTITRSMATFTLMQIFKDQGMYEHALEVLEFLREKSSNQERIDMEYEEIQKLLKDHPAKSS